MLEYISDMMTELQIPYEFECWTAETIEDPYFVGEYNEAESATLEESGYQEITFILTGTGTKWIELEAAKNKIKTNLPKSAILKDSSGIAVLLRLWQLFSKWMHLRMNQKLRQP